jgi:hypothetical protein
LGEEWSEIAERVIYKLSDFAPDVVAELTSALRSLEKSELSEPDCGQVAANLRRSVELLAELLTAGNPTDLANSRLGRPPHGDKYKDQLKNYLNKHFASNQYLRDELWNEIQHLGNLLNKGVHEHWMMRMIRPLAIRTILVINRLLFPVKAGVVQCRMGDDLFT